MKLACYFFIITLFSINSFSSKENKELSVESVIDSVVSNYKKNYSISFDMYSHNKYVSEQDTMATTYSCKYYRLNDNNVSSCYIYIQDSNGGEKYYDFNQIYIIDPSFMNRPMIIIHLNNELERDYNLDIYFDLFQGAHSFDNYFLNLENLEKIKTDSSKKVLLTQNENEIILKQKWIGENKNSKSAFWNEFIIDKYSYNIIKKILHMDFEEMTQHEIFEIKNIKYNDFDTLKISRRIDSLKSIYKVE